MAGEETKHRSKPWEWPFEWFADETFSRDVASRTLAGLIVLFVVWGVGIAAGVFTGARAIDAFRVILLLLALFWAVFTAIYMLRLGFSKGGPIRPSGPNGAIFPRWLALIVAVGNALDERVHRLGDPQYRVLGWPNPITSVGILGELASGQASLFHGALRLALSAPQPRLPLLT